MKITSTAKSIGITQELVDDIEARLLGQSIQGRCRYYLYLTGYCGHYTSNLSHVDENVDCINCKYKAAHRE